MKTKTHAQNTTTGMDFSRAATVGPDRVASAAQAATKRECQYPLQPKHKSHESFEPYGLN